MVVVTRCGIAPWNHFLPHLKIITIMFIHRITWYIKFIQYTVGYGHDNTIMYKMKPQSPTPEILNVAKAIFKSWQQLIRHIGGVSLSQSTYSPSLRGDQITKKNSRWKSFQSPGQLLIKKNEQIHVEIKRLEPNQAERILGVRLVMDGQIDTEFEHCLSQAHILRPNIT